MSRFHDAGGDGARVSMGKENEMNVLPLKI